MPRSDSTRGSSTSSTPGKRDSLALGENRFTHFRGDAYKLFTTASEKKGFLVKGQLLALMRKLVKQGKFVVSSEEKLSVFVDEEFVRFDIDRNQRLSFEEFLTFFGTWLDSSALNLEDMHARLAHSGSARHAAALPGAPDRLARAHSEALDAMHSARCSSRPATRVLLSVR